MSAWSLNFLPVRSPRVRHVFELLTVHTTAGKAAEVFIALASAAGNKGFFKNKGPDPTVWDGRFGCLGFADLFP